MQDDVIEELLRVVYELKAKVEKLENDLSHVKKIVYMILSGIITLFFTLLTKLLGG